MLRVVICKDTLAFVADFISFGMYNSLDDGRRVRPAANPIQLGIPGDRKHSNVS